ncbi:MAG: glycosyltransferase family 39 protein [Chloroflexi bacterium OHK40]
MLTTAMAVARRHWLLWIALAVGLILRIALWDNLPRLGLVSDEAEYLASADWLAAGRGFAWHTQYLWTRAPGYPLFLAAHIASFGRVLEPIYVAQVVLSMVNVGLVYALALLLVGGAQRNRDARGAAGIAALLTALYLPLAAYTQLLLSETLFITLLLAALLALGGALRAGPWVGLGLHVAGGTLLGLATLTRGLTLGFLPLVAGWALLMARGQGQRWSGALAWAAACTLPAALVILPWSVYASRAYGGPMVVDTTGAFNLMLGARTAFDGGRSDAPSRNFVLALLDPALTREQREALLAARPRADGGVQAGACLYEARDERLLAALERPAASLSQGDRQRLMSAEAFCLLRAAPGAFVTKSLVELIDLFQINYTGDERLSKGFALGRLPPWYVLASLLLDDTLYVLSLPLAVLGWAKLRSHPSVGAVGVGQPAEAGGRGAGEPVSSGALRAAAGALVGLWLLYNLAAAPLLFAINRFRVPLMPLLFVFAGFAIVALPRLGPTLRSRYGAACALLAALLLFVAASPHAYLEPRAPGAPSRWASYLGPYPSSLASAWRALVARPSYLRGQELAAALGAGDVASARRALAAPELAPYDRAVGAPLLDGLEGRPADGLDRLATQPERPLEGWQTSLVAGELFRQLGDLEAARRELNPEHVDRENPVAWAWLWLAPPPLPGNRIELADDNDLGYIRGFYLGRYDADLGATVRWATGEAALRFPGAGSGAPQRLCLAASSLGWPADLRPPTVAAWLDDELLGSFAPGAELEEYCLPLPARPAGSELVITLRAPTFVPGALDLIAQQGPQVGQLRLLGFQLDWAEVR